MTFLYPSLTGRRRTRRPFLRRLTALALGALLTLLPVTGCAPGTTDGTKPGSQETPEARTGGDDHFKVGIVQMVENGAFDDMRRGFIEGLREQGYGEDRVEIVYENAQGDASTLNTIVRGMNDGSYDLVATIATPPTQAFVNLGSETPNVFVAVSDPVGAGILSSFDAPDKHATGTSNPIPVKGIFALAEDLTPEVKHFGILYSTNEINAQHTAQDAMALLDGKDGFSYTEGTVSNSSEVQQVARDLLEQTDGLYIPNDSIIQNAMAVVVDAANKAGKPVYGSSAVMVMTGALASVAVSDTTIGRISSEMAVKILEGASPADVPARAVEGKVVDLNLKTAETLGIELPEAIAANAVVHE